jgi:glutathione S-transferase
VAVEEWLMWQMGGFGPMLGQAHHFRNYAPERIDYGIERYTNEANRLYGVLNDRLADRDYVAGDYSIADMAIWPWVLPEGQGQSFDDFPHLKAWHERVGARPGVQRGRSVGKDRRMSLAEDSEEAREAKQVLFGQRARTG